MRDMIGAVSTDAFLAGFRPVRGLLESYRPKDQAAYEQTLAMVKRGSLREAMVSGDLPYILGASSDLLLMDAYGSVAQPWRSVFKIGSLPNFRQYKFAELTELQTDDQSGSAAINGLMPNVPEGLGYSEARLSEHYETATLETYGVTFTLTRQMLLNDDLNALRTLPSALGRGMARTLNWHVANALALTSSTTVSGHLCADGYNFFGTSNHANMVSSATPLSAANVKTQANLFGAQTTPLGVTNNALGITAEWIVVPAALRLTAQEIISNAALIGAGTTVQTSQNILANMRVCVIPELDAFSSKDWYLAADPNVCAGFQVSFLGGRETPELFTQDSTGGDLSSADGQKYKIRHDFDVHPLVYSAWRKIDDTTS